MIAGLTGGTIHAQLHRCRSVRFAKALRGDGGERRHFDRADLSRPRQERRILPMIHLPELRNEALAVYEHWLNKPDKIVFGTTILITGELLGAGNLPIGAALRVLGRSVFC